LLAHFGKKPLTGIQPLAGPLIYSVGLAPDGNTLRLAPGAVCVTLQENDHG